MQQSRGSAELQIVSTLKEIFVEFPMRAGLHVLIHGHAHVMSSEELQMVLTRFG